MLWVTQVTSLHNVRPYTRARFTQLEARVTLHCDLCAWSHEEYIPIRYASSAALQDRRDFRTFKYCQHCESDNIRTGDPWPKARPEYPATDIRACDDCGKFCDWEKLEPVNQRGNLPLWVCRKCRKARAVLAECERGIREIKLALRKQ